MTTTVNLDHNIGDLVSDIDDVQSDITHEMRKRVGRAMTRLWADTRQYVLDDPHASGDLFAAIEQSERIGDEMLTFKVFADTSEDAAPYAAVTEFGSGERLNTPYSTAKKVPPPTPEEQPPDYPYKAPDIDNIQGFAYYIEIWMDDKGVEPRYGDMTASSMAIAKSIARYGTYAHPYLRPAWFDNELQIQKAAVNAVQNAVR